MDDGSADDIGSLVGEWQREADFDIQFWQQSHGHKKTAVNLGVKHAKGELIAVLDDDDEALPNSISDMAREWHSIPMDRRELFWGVVGLCVSAESGEIVGDRFPLDVMDCSLLDAFYRNRVRGEKWGCFRTDLVRQQPYPEDIEGYVPESVVWFAIARTYLTRCVNVPLRRYFADPDSVTASMKRASGSIANAEGLGLWARETLLRDWAWARHDPLWFLRMAVNYSRWRLHMGGEKRRKQGDVDGMPQSILVCLVWPLGLLRYLTDVFEYRMKNLWSPR